MSAPQYAPYYSVPTGDKEESIPLTYPPTTPPAIPTPNPQYPPQTPPVPSSSASNTFPFSTDSPLELDHDFTADQKRPALEDSHRWSVNSYNRPAGLRRFSRPWWSYYWRLQVSRRRMPRFMYIITGLILMAVWLAIATAFAMTLQSAEAENGNGNINTPANVILSGGFSHGSILFFLSGSLNTFDPTSRTINVDWSALMAQGPLVGGVANASQVSVELYGDDPIAIFRDTVARFDNFAAQNITEYLPFRLKAPGIPPIGYLGISEFDSINTDITLQQASAAILAAPEFSYPFDLWTGNITFVAANNKTITTTKRPGSDVQRLHGAVLQDSVLGFKVYASSMPTCLDADSPGCELVVTITVQRTGLVKFCVIVVFVVGWIITIAIFLITGEALLLNRSNILEGTDILAICFTALFALPTVRSLLPNVPSSYGCLLDILGILPNVIIVTLCTTFFTNSRLRMRARRAAEAAAQAKEQAKNA